MEQYEVWTDQYGNQCIQLDDGSWISFEAPKRYPMKPGYFKKRELKTREELESYKLVPDFHFTSDKSDLRLLEYTPRIDEKELDEIAEKLRKNFQAQRTKV